MQVDLTFEPPSQKEIVSDSQTHRLQIPGLRDDFRFLWESSSYDGVLDGVLPADVPLYMASKSRLYDLSLYEVGSHLRLYLLKLTQKYSVASLSTSLRLHIVVASPKGMHLRQDVQE